MSNYSTEECLKTENITDVYSFSPESLGLNL